MCRESLNADLRHPRGRARVTPLLSPPKRRVQPLRTHASAAAKHMHEQRSVAKAWPKRAMVSTVHPHLPRRAFRRHASLWPHPADKNTTQQKKNKRHGAEELHPRCCHDGACVFLHCKDLTFVYIGSSAAVVQSHRLVHAKSSCTLPSTTSSSPPLLSSPARAKDTWCSPHYKQHGLSSKKNERKMWEPFAGTQCTLHTMSIQTTTATANVRVSLTLYMTCEATHHPRWCVRHREAREKHCQARSEREHEQSTIGKEACSAEYRAA